MTIPSPAVWQPATASRGTGRRARWGPL